MDIEIANSNSIAAAMAAEALVQELMSLLSGVSATQAILIAAKLGIADLLHPGPLSCTALAEATEVHAPSLHRVLRALSSVGIFAEDARGRFVLTPLANLLRSDVPESLRAFAIMRGEHWGWGSLGEIEHGVCTGQSAFRYVFGAPLFDHYTAHPDVGEVSADVLNNLSEADDAAIVGAYEFPDSGTVVDVGGGQGTLLAAILVANPGLRGVLFERPSVLEIACARLVAAGVSARCELVAGDFFINVPGKGNFYLLKQVIHNWSDEAAQAILLRLRSKMPLNARLLLAERILPKSNQPSAAKWLDLLMLAYAGGMERTASEFTKLLASAGFAITRIMPTMSNIQIIEALLV